MANREAQKVAQFEIISKENYDRMISHAPHLYSNYDEIKIPTRATDDSAGYDFYLNDKEIELLPGESYIIKTFLRVKIDRPWALICIPKSGLGFNYHVKLANTVGLIDGDYYNTKTDDNTNEGHIMIKLVNTGNKTLKLTAGDKFCQGIFIQYGITYDDDIYYKQLRNGGIGSTGK